MPPKKSDKGRPGELVSLAVAIENAVDASSSPTKKEDASQPIVSAGISLLKALVGTMPLNPADLQALKRTGQWYDPGEALEESLWRTVSLQPLVVAIESYSAVVLSQSWKYIARALNTVLEELIASLRALARAKPDLLEKNAAAKGLSERIDSTTAAMRPVMPMLQAAEELQEIRHIRERAEKAVGEIADLEISSFFARYAKVRRKSYWYWTAAFVLSLIVSIVIAVRPLDAAGVNTWEEFSDLALALPAIVLAAYTARQAGQNRRIAEWAELAYLRARSIDAYVQRLPRERAMDVLHKFGLAIYTSDLQPLAEGASDSDVASGILGRALDRK